MKNLLQKIQTNKILVELVDGKLSVFHSDGEIDPAVLEEIKARKEELIQFLETSRSPDPAASGNSEIPVCPREDCYVLSSSQARIWVLSQTEKGSIAYHIPGLYSLEGELDPESLDNAFASLVRRHEVLRTVFIVNEAGDPRQYISDAETSVFALSCHDLRDDEDKEKRVNHLVEMAVTAPFDLAAGPLFRASLYRLEANKYLLSFVIHHIISDGWSMELLIRQLVRHYDTYRRGVAASLPTLRIQYKDYAVWQQQQLASGALWVDAQYWAGCLTGVLPILELEPDRRRPVLKGFNGSSYKKVMSCEGYQALKAYCQRKQASLFMGVLSLVNILLHRYTGQTDIIIGSPVAGRELPELEDIIGLFINTIPLRVQCSGDDNFDSLLHRIKALVLEAFAHQAFPFDEQVNLLDIKRDGSRNPLFDVMVVLRDVGADLPIPPEKAGGLSIGSIDAEWNSGKMDLVFEFAEIAGELQLKLEYDSDLYDPDRIVRVVDDLDNLLLEVVGQPLMAIDAFQTGKRMEYTGRKGVAHTVVADYLAPHNFIENSLAAIWQDVLGKGPIGVKDDFFEKGGHSVKIIRLASRIHKTFGKKIDVQTLFVATTLEEQARFIAAGNPMPYASIPALPVSLPSYPLSPTQRRIWALSQFREGNIAYHIPGACVLEEVPDPALLEYCFSVLIARHDSLRTVFRENERGEIRQYILGTAETGFHLAQYDLRREADPQASLDRMLGEVNATPFQLDKWPLFRASLFRIADRKWIFSCIIHHIVCDGWSMDILVRELWQLYRRASRGDATPAAPLRIQYKDYAVWKQEQLKTDAYRLHEEYWLGQLSGELPVLELPTDKARPALKTYRGAVVRSTIPTASVEGLKTLCGRRGATLFMGLTGVLKTLLYRYTGLEDIIIGSPVTGREHLELEDQVGMYLNMLALRTRFSADEPFESLLEHIRRTTLDAYDHQVYPFDELLENLGLQRQPGREALFDILIDYHDEGPGGVIPYDGGGHVISKFDLSLIFTETEGGLSVLCEYNTDILSRETAERFTNHFGQLLDSVIGSPAMPIGRLSYIPDAERNQLLEVFNGMGAAGGDSDTGAGEYQTVLDLFSRQVRHSPDKIAVTGKDSRCTFRQLDERSERLAAYLRWKYGIREDIPVGIMLDRSVGMIVALLAVLKAGCAYVPIDPAYPSARQQYILQHTGISLLLTQSKYLEALAGYTGEVFVQDDSGAIPDSSSPMVRPGADRPAYIIYTSGSTGRPKGCTLSHGNLYHYISWANGYYFKDREPAVFPLFTSLSFDLTVTSIFCPLTQGGRIVVFGQEEALPTVLEHIFSAAAGINSIKLTPAHVSLIKQLDLKATAVGIAILGGEEVTPEQVGALKGINPSMRVFNEYGPTEATVGCVVKELRENEPVLIGKPIQRTAIYITDNTQRLCATGIRGELCIGGPGVAKGYWNDDWLTSERFIENPFRQGERIYRTGDVAKWLPTGELAFLGRKDNQVKIKGYRIEIAEVEAALRDQPGVDSAIVLCRVDPAGTKSLVAYVAPGDEIELRQLRAGLADLLPEYMVPAHLVPMDYLPMTINGKIDRGQLPDPWRSAGEMGITYAAASNPVEAKLVRLLEEILQCSPIGVKDNFFAIGGDSIMAVMFIVRVKREFDTDISVDQWYECQTIEKLALCLVDASAHQQAPAGSQELETGLAEIREIQESIEKEDQGKRFLPLQYEAIYPLVAIEEGMIYSSLLSPEEPIYYDQFSYPLQIEDAAKFTEGLRALVVRHSMLRTKYYMGSFSRPVKVTLPDIPLPMSFVNLSDRPAAEKQVAIREYIQSDLDQRFRFDDELLWRIRLFQLEGKNFFVTYSFHHALLDGWSVSILQTELSNFGGQPPRPLPYSYKDYCALKLARKRSPAIETYWKENLAGYLRNKLPFNYKGSRLNGKKGMRTLRRDIGKDLLHQVSRLSSAHMVAFKSVCVAAHIFLLHLISSEDDIVTGVVTHDRPEIEDSERILGCFLNTLPIRIRITEMPDRLGLIKKVDACLTAMRLHEMHLTEITRIIGEKTTSANPVFDTILNYTDFHAFSGLSHDLYSGEGTIDLETAHEMTNTLFDVEVDRTLDNFSVRIKYAVGYFNEAEVRYALELYVRILDGFIRGLHEPLDFTSLVTPMERIEILSGWNDTRAPYAEDKTIQWLLEKQASLHPNAVALRQNDLEISYSRLNERANQLAWFLIGKGVRNGDNIGLLVTRSFDMIVGMFGILKSGGAYVPIDPNYPIDRQQYIAGNSAVTTMVTDDDLSWQGGGVERISLHDERINSCSSHNPEVPVTSRQLAYTIYTSGSTGRPKGVMIEHHSVINLIEWVNETFDIRAGDRLLFVTSMCFDLSVYDIFGILAAGGTVVIARQEEVQDIQQLKALLTTGKISFWDSVPTTMQYLVDELEAEAEGFLQRDLRLVFLSGDWIPVSLPDRIRRLFPRAKVISLGGATEGTVWSNFYRIGDVDAAWTSIPYGRPLKNNFFYILNERRQLVPKGVAGELYIGGVGVARGYANDAGKTGYSFVADPFHKEFGGRMYRTGDVGRLMADGNMEFLGRKDNQVKIRGFRVEPGEIEYILLKHEKVKEAIVHVFRDGNNNNQLFACLVMSEPVDRAVLRDHLKGLVPAYMVPNYFIFLEALPLNSNGKIDRKALPLPTASTESQEPHHIPAGSASEKTVERIWQTILNLDRISMRDDLFDLGANSLSVGAFVNRVQRELGQPLTIRDVFVNPTIGGIAAVLHGLDRAAYEAIEPAPEADAYDLSSQQKELWISGQFEEVNRAFNMPGVYILEGDLNKEALESAIGQLIGRQEILRTVFRTNESGVVKQIVLPAMETGFRMSFTDLQEFSRPEEKVKELAQSELLQTFDLAAGPLLRVKLYRIGQHKWVLTYVMHHIIGDGWSMIVLIKELLALYNAKISGGASPLPLMRIHYKDFARWQQNRLVGTATWSHRQYWLAQFEERTPLPELPFSRPRPLMKTYSGGVVRTKLGQQLTGQLKEMILEAKEGTTLFMGLYAAVNILLYKYTGETDIVIGTSTAGREKHELEDQIGYYLNTLPLRSRFDPGDNFGGLLGICRQVIIEANEHQMYPYEELVEALHRRGDGFRRSLFNHFIVMRDVAISDAPTYTFGNLTVKEFGDIEYQVSKFDMTFIFYEMAGEVSLALEYNLDLFGYGDATRVAEEFRALVTDITSTPSKPIRELIHSRETEPAGDRLREQAFQSTISTEF